jgi:hypothetical protein
MATAKPKSTKSAPASESLRVLYRPGVLERGLKIVAKSRTMRRQSRTSLRLKPPLTNIIAWERPRSSLMHFSR